MKTLLYILTYLAFGVAEMMYYHYLNPNEIITLNGAVALVVFWPAALVGDIGDHLLHWTSSVIIYPSHG